jgi:hypothetical protein
MKKIFDLVGRELIWSQPGALEMGYELRDRELVVATLRFRSILGSFATAESGDGSWTLKRVGFLESRVTIRESGCETDLGVFHNNTWDHGGTLEMRDGRKYLANVNFWATQYSFKTEMDEEIVSYRKIDGVLHMSAKVEIAAKAREIAETPWIVFLGWYLVVMMNTEMLPIHHPVNESSTK